MSSSHASYSPGHIIHRLRSQPSENTILLGLAVILGLATGAGVWVFRSGIDFFNQIFSEKLGHELLGRWLGAGAFIVTLAFAGFIVGWLMNRFVGHERRSSVTAIIESVALSGGRLRYSVMPIKALCSALSLGAGASVGPEAPSVMIGANLGSYFSQRLQLSEERGRLLVAAGAASAIAAAFRAPIAGVFFALEVVLNGEFNTGSFGVVVLAAVVSSVFIQTVEHGAGEFGLLNFTLGNPAELLLYVLLGALLAPVSVFFIRFVHWQHDLWDHHIHLSRPVKTAFAGALVGIVAIWLPQIMGSGRGMMASVLDGTHFTIGLLLVLAVAKLMMSAVSIGGGFVGGIFAPTLFVGTMLGSAFGQIAASITPAGFTGSPQAYAIAGMAGVMAGVVRAPITAILLVFELTNDYRLILPIMLTTVICVYLTERLVPAGIDMLPLLEAGLRLHQGRDVDVMQGVTVREAMTAPAPTIHETAALTELRDVLREQRIRSVCVVDDNGQLAGIVTLTDLQKAYEKNAGEGLRVADICTREVIVADPDEPLWKAIRSMGTRDVGRLPVVAGDKILGMVGRHDIMRAYNTAIARKLEHQHQTERIRLNTLTGAHIIELRVEDGASVDGKQISAVEWPPESVVAAVFDHQKLIVPHGNTEIHAGDMLTLVAAPEVEAELRQLITAAKG